ncbi:flavin reductase family protein [Anaeromicropila populeti]|uniref:NADH-FMN oxidoreductase RutF, flavin reductase (DIM6/NTAB) family n=1 Tax=Anaeromicropila populeti TaxID=37658 RepID=A0A1I6I5J6_9FIRM|nr:flavin reductase family protein [Anaeromicropila populeti]SFR61973.1 NADH-FMN oxidoreductase RutF, flavin reductase (DIM6/NTAB) family [Anaeromicropila populeti]
MAKQFWKPGNMLYPLPAVLVSCGIFGEEVNAFTVAWTGTICTNPAMVYISVRPERYSYDLIKKTGEFVINLTTKKLVKEVDYCGVRSGRKENKFARTKLTPEKANKVKAPLIAQCPVSIECKVKEVKKLGSHHMFIADVLGVNVEESYLDAKGKFELNRSDLLIYSHGEYYNMGKLLGSFGYSVKKKGKGR